MERTKPSPDMGPVVVGAVMTSAVAILALLSLGVLIFYITLPPSPYPPMDTPGCGLFPLFCFGTFLVLALFALFLGSVTIKSYKARRADAANSGQSTG